MRMGYINHYSREKKKCIRFFHLYTSAYSVCLGDGKYNKSIVKRKIKTKLKNC